MFNNRNALKIPVSSRQRWRRGWRLGAGACRCLSRGRAPRRARRACRTTACREPAGPSPQVLVERFQKKNLGKFKAPNPSCVCFEITHLQHNTYVFWCAKKRRGHRQAMVNWNLDNLKSWTKPVLWKSHANLSCGYLHAEINCIVCSDNWNPPVFLA